MMNQKLASSAASLLFVLGSILFISACGDKKAPTDEEIAEALGDNGMIYPDIKVSPSTTCSTMTDSFCDQLYDSQHEGNANLSIGGDTVRIRFGYTPNGHYYTENTYYIAQWLARSKLPSPLEEILNHYQYFDMLLSYLKGKTLEQSESVDEARDHELLRQKVATTWDIGVAAMIAMRLETEIPDYPEIKSKRKKGEVNEVQIEQISNEVKASIYKAIWENNALWKKAEIEFDEVQKTYLEAIDNNFDIPASSRSEWRDRISSVKIISPSSDPEHLDEACARSERNAYLDIEKNAITVCAGLLGTQDLKFVLAHEISHTLGIANSVRVHTMQSEYATNMKTLRDQICKPTSSGSCPGAWKNFQDGYVSSIDQVLQSFKPIQPELLACLQYNQKDIAKVSVDTSYIQKLAAGESKKTMAKLGDEGRFLDLSKPSIELPDGTETPNPAYFNPCGYADWSENDYTVGSRWDLQFFYSAAYQCDAVSSDDEVKKMGKAMDQAKDAYAHVLEKTIPMGGIFSKDENMEAQDYSEDSEERFADNMGARVFSQLLAKTSEEQRLTTYFSNTAFFCTPPSNMKKYPNEAQEEKRHCMEPHSAGRQRILETLIKPIRDNLNCGKKSDDEIKDCELSDK